MRTVAVSKMVTHSSHSSGIAAVKIFSTRGFTLLSSPDCQDSSHREQRKQQVAVLHQEELERLPQVSHGADRHDSDESEPVEKTDGRSLQRRRCAGVADGVEQDKCHDKAAGEI